MLRPTTPRRKPDPNITMINIVFLMLIFFMVAGSLAPPLSRTITPADSAAAAPVPPPDALVLTREGILQFRGQTLSPGEAFSLAGGSGSIRLLPDRATDARLLLQTVAGLKSAGANKVILLTERSAP